MPSGLYEIVDPLPIATAAPYTFFLPHQLLLDAVQIGDHVQAIIRTVPPSQKYDAERMWIHVTEVQTEYVAGALDSDPFDMPQLPRGTAVQVPKAAIINVLLRDPERIQGGLPGRRQYWERCLVDQCVLDGELKVGYIYREMPDIGKEGDKFPDSGWRIRGDTRGDLVKQIGSRKVAYVAIGAVLNEDDSWLHLVDEPIGAEFERDFDSRTYIRVT